MDKKILMNKSNVLLSFPRSGKNWVSYFIKAISKQPIAGHEEYTTVTQELGVDINKENILVLVHRADHPWDSWRPNNCNLLLLLRNYKEAIIRHVNFVPDNELIGQCIEGYMHCLSYYDSFQGNKHIVYYEDLILNPKEEIDKILNFLEIPHNEHYVEFFANFNNHKENSVKNYHGGSITKGNAQLLRHHSQFMDVEILNKISGLVKSNKNLYKKYLKRYS